MAETESDHRFGQCRCCLDVGYHKDIAEPYHRNGARETYRETFLKCFNLVLSTNTKLTNMICTSCISRLNDATEFVTMVVESEKQLLKQINNTSDIEFINVTEDHDGGVCNHEEDDNNLMKVEDDVDCSTVEDDISVQEELDSQTICHYDFVSQFLCLQYHHQKEEADIKVIKVELEEVDSSNVEEEQIPTNNDQDKKIHTKDNRSVQEKDQGDNNDNVSLEQEDDIECNDIDSEEVIKQVPVVNSQLLNVNSTTDLKLTTQEAEHIAADMDLSRKKRKTDTKCHPDESYACKICDKKFSTNHNFKTHVRIHTGEKPYSCDICDKNFIQSSHLTKHVRTHTGEKPYACKLCNKKFADNSNLSKHIRTHTSEQPYACEICDKKFIKSSDLIKHIRTHTGEKPHACRICDKKFARNDHLTRHVRTHMKQT